MNAEPTQDAAPAPEPTAGGLRAEVHQLLREIGWWPRPWEALDAFMFGGLVGLVLGLLIGSAVGGGP